VILVCSPKGNRQSSKVAEQIKLPFIFETAPTGKSVLKDRDTGLEFLSPWDQQSNRFDLALVAGWKDKLRNRRVLLLWGIHGVGTVGAAKFLTNPSNLKHICRTAKGEDFALVVKVPFESNLEPLEPEPLTPVRVGPWS